MGETERVCVRVQVCILIMAVYNGRVCVCVCVNVYMCAHVSLYEYNISECVRRIIHAISEYVRHVTLACAGVTYTTCLTEYVLIHIQRAHK